MHSSRYARHLVLPDFGEAAQRRLGESTVLIVGLGGLGNPAAAYLAAAGVGRLLLADFDTVDEANLQRQILFATADIGRYKIEAGSDRLTALNSECEFVLLRERLIGNDLVEAVTRANLVLDGSDNFATRFAVNAACRRAGVPLVSGAAIRWEGHVQVFDFRDPDSPCYRCLYPETSEEDLENCRSNGVLGPLVGVIGSLQAVEAVKLLTGTGESLAGRMLRYDARTARWKESRLNRDPACPECGGARDEETGR
jgi:adenylyltransferase/sulfurtransferase